MNKKFLVAWLVVFVVWLVGGFVVHGVMLNTDYANLPDLFRSENEPQQYFPFMLLAHVLMAAAFVCIYTRGVESKPWLAQGLRFGLVIALLTTVPIYLIYYAVQPMPGMIVARQIVF